MIRLHEISRIPDISEACWQIGISPDGQFIACARHSEPNVVQLLDLQGSVFKKMEGHRAHVHSISFARDGRSLASGAADKTVRIWSPTGDLLVLFDRFSVGVESVSYSPDAPILAAGQLNGDILTFDFAGNYIATLQSPKSRIYCLDWSAGCRYLAAASADGGLYIYKVKEQTKTVITHPGPVYGARFLGANGKLASTCEDGQIRLFNIIEKTINPIARHDKRAVGIDYSAKHDLIASGGFDNRIALFDHHGNPRGDQRLDAAALGTTFSPDGSKLFVTTKDRNLHIFEIERVRE